MEGLTLQELIDHGCTRSAHPGLLNTENTTLAPLIGGMPIHYHDFQMHAGDTDYNICSFHIVKTNGQCEIVSISADKSIWGPLARWDPKGRQKIIKDDFRFRHLAEQASSPYAFHLAATKSVAQFNNVTSSCSFFLASIANSGKHSADLMKSILVDIANPRGSGRNGRPKTFYRVIDENGLSWKLKSISNDPYTPHKVLEYRNGYRISTYEVADNVMTTFTEIYNLEHDPAYIMPKRPRLVPDTGFYLAMAALTTSHKKSQIGQVKDQVKQPCTAYHLAGNEMMNYLVYDSKSASMYRKQAHKIIALVNHNFDINLPVTFKVVSPIRVVGANQYSLNNRQIHVKSAKPGTTLYVT